MYQINANAKSSLELGRQGENLARQVVFDLSGWVAEYGAGTAELIVQRPGEKETYPAAIDQDGAAVTWTLTAADTALASTIDAGNGHCELRWYVGELLAKSRIWRTWVSSAMDTPTAETPPAPEQGWVERVLEAGVSAKEAAERAEKAAIHQPYPNADTETWWVWDVETGVYVDSGQQTGGGVTDHSKLTGRDAENQHPISAIAQLSSELNKRMQTGDVISALDIISIMEG